MLAQVIFLFIVLSASILAISFIFWLLFKKDAPSLEELKRRYKYHNV